MLLSPQKETINMAIKPKVEILSIKKDPLNLGIHIKRAPNLLDRWLRGCEGVLPCTWH